LFAPKRPESVPKEAIWKGSCDGGYWIELVSINKNNKYRFRIYQDWDGELLMDADFKFEKEKKINLTFANWRSLVCCYSYAVDDSLATLTVAHDIGGEKKYYLLQSIFPAYEGVDWEIIKDKYNIE
jgi:hypothetical protein